MAKLMKRGDIVLCNLGGDYGKPRPAVIVQSDIFNVTHASIEVCPITSCLIDAPLFRIEISPTKKNGLLKKSQIMVDKMSAIKRDKISDKVGILSAREQESLSNAIKLWLNLEDITH
jgi:mRNA interferase MazF